MMSRLSSDTTFPSKAKVLSAIDAAEVAKKAREAEAERARLRREEDDLIVFIKRRISTDMRAVIDPSSKAATDHDAQRFCFTNRTGDPDDAVLAPISDRVVEEVREHFAPGGWTTDRTGPFTLVVQ